MKIKVLGIIALSGVILATVGFLIFKSSTGQENSTKNIEQESEKKLEANGNKFLAPTNAFLPPPPVGLYREEPPVFIQPSKEPSLNFSPPQIPTFGTSSFTDLSKIQELISHPTLIPPRQDEILTLPTVSASELAVDPNGVEDLSGYLDYFATHSTEIKFSYEKFGNILKDASGTILFPTDLIEKSLKDNDFISIHDSLAIHKEFILVKIDFLKSIKVAGDAIEVNKTMIGLDKLTLELIEKTFAVETASITKTKLENFYKKYKNTAIYYNQQFREKTGGLSFLDNKNMSRGFLNEVLNLFGLRKIAQALGIPFGGPIIVVVPCLCTGGLFFTVGPPVGGMFFISFATIASPALFAYKAIHPGAYILGNYAPGAVCLNPNPALAPPCIPIFFPFGTITIAGTSI